MWSNPLFNERLLILTLEKITNSFQKFNQRQYNISLTSNVSEYQTQLSTVDVLCLTLELLHSAQPENQTTFARETI